MALFFLLRFFLLISLEHGLLFDGKELSDTKATLSEFTTFFIWNECDTFFVDFT